MKNLIIILLSFIISFLYGWENKSSEFKVIAYFAGSKKSIDKYPMDQLTHIIYSFVHLDGNKLKIDDETDESTVRYLVSLKDKHPKLKVMVAMGGWGGCYSCSEIFSCEDNIKTFAKSAREMMDHYRLDGLDLDWEYPAIEGVPDHPYSPDDRFNFTKLIQELRKQFDDDYAITFAAGGFDDYLENSVEWDKVMPLVDHVNLMSYDLVNGYSKVTGHHTPLYSTMAQKLSVEYSVNYLDSLGIPLQKIVIGAAFYGRMWKNVPNINHGLHQPGIPSGSTHYDGLFDRFKEEEGYHEYFDEKAGAFYRYNSAKQFFITYDNHYSIRLKTQYALSKNLGGIMFWQLNNDQSKNGLLQTIYDTVSPD